MVSTQCSKVESGTEAHRIDRERRNRKKEYEDGQRPLVAAEREDTQRGERFEWHHQLQRFNHGRWPTYLPKACTA